MESQDHFKAVIELGKRLVSQLELADDLLAQWMAHDIATHIKAAEKAHPEASLLEREACAKSILTLWKHRNELPDHLRVFKEIEPLMRTLSTLDVDNGDDCRYFYPALKQAALDGTDGREKKWLKVAFDLDCSVRILIQYALRSAFADTALKAKEWVDVALRAEADPVAERHVLEFVLGKSSDMAGQENLLRNNLSENIERLESFAHLATAMAGELKVKLGSVTAFDNKSSGMSDG